MSLVVIGTLAHDSVETAHDGQEALEKITAQSFDLVLTDVVMPNMDGHELFLKVRELQPELPVGIEGHAVLE